MKILKIFLFLSVGVVVLTGVLWFYQRGTTTPETITVYKTTPISERSEETGSHTHDTKQSTAIRAEQERTQEPETHASGFVDKDGDGVVTLLEVMNQNLPWSHPDNVRARHRLTIANRKSEYTLEELESPETKKYFELLESQEYLERVLNGATLNELMNFLADNGIPEARDFMHQPFREHFPTGVADDYEPEMRERLKSLILENGGYDSSVFRAFLEPPEVSAWFMSKFMSQMTTAEPNGRLSLGYDWSKSVEAEAFADINASAQNAIETGIAPEVEDLQTSVESPDTPTNTGLYPEPLDPKMDEASDNSRAPVELQQQLQELSEARHRLLDALNEEEDIQTAFRKQFSPERFERALQTLNQYGPEEGLRRLKESDPEVATQLERILPKQQAED